MKNSLNRSLSIFCICIFMFLPLSSLGQVCTAGSLQYRPYNECATQTRKCCPKSGGTDWGDWGTGECKGTPCERCTEPGMLQNPDVIYQEEGECCITACEHPDMMNTCDCIDYAMYEPCECYAKNPGIYREFFLNDYCGGDEMCLEWFMSDFIANICYSCPGYLIENRALCCSSMGGELNNWDNKCYSDKYEWVRGDTFYSGGGLCYDGHCSVIMSFDAPSAACGNSYCSASNVGKRCSKCTSYKYADSSGPMQMDWCKGSDWIYGNTAWEEVCTRNKKVLFE